MTCNVGGTERAVRVAVGVVLIGAGALAGFPMWGTAVAVVVGAVALLTGAVGFCPAWKLFGVNTCPTKSEQ
jgi:hypothetical protein